MIGAVRGHQIPHEKSWVLVSVSIGALVWATQAFAQTAPGPSDSATAVQGTGSGQTANAKVQSANKSDQSTQVSEVLVQGSRLPASVRTMPQSVVIVTSQKIDQQIAFTNDLQTMLANTVPGLSQSSGNTSETLFSLRGRKPVVLIDGIPVSSTLNDTGRELAMIDPEDISRVEVVPGSSALYGQSEGAGFINFITKGGSPGTANFRTEVGTAVSLTNFSGDSLQPFVRQEASGTIGNFDYRFAGSYSAVNSLFDARGARLPPPVGAAINDSRTGSVLGKVGYNFENQRIEASVYYDKEESHLKYGIVNGNILTRTPATAVPAQPQPGEVPQLNDEFLANLVYANSSLLGSTTSVRAQLYYYHSFSIFQFVVNRFPLVVGLGESPNAQSENDTSKYGVRIDFNTPFKGLLPFNGQLLYGVDYMHDDTTIPLVDGRAFGIPQTLNSIAGFAQLQFQPIERLTLTAGIREERDTLNVSNFFSLFTLAHITGGTINYTATPLNGGAVFAVTHNIDLFAGYSQGFNIQQTSQVFRSWPVDINLTVAKPPPNVVDSVEGGLRVHTHDFTTSVTGFYNKSSNAITFSFNPAFPQDPAEAFTPDKVWGVEAEADYRGIDNLDVGVSYAHMEGLQLVNGKWGAIQDRTIPPQSATIHVQYTYAPNSFVSFQGYYSGFRNKFPGVPPGIFYEGEIDPYFVADMAVKYDLSNLHSRYLRGDVTIGIQNLFNENYFTAYSQGYNQNNNYIKGQGRTLTIRYGISY